MSSAEKDMATVEDQRTWYILNVYPSIKEKKEKKRKRRKRQSVFTSKSKNSSSSEGKGSQVNSFRRYLSRSQEGKW
jgi:hypothetical protein